MNNLIVALDESIPAWESYAAQVTNPYVAE